MTLSQNDACKRLCAIGIPRQTRLGILDTVSRWERESGPAWTVKRLKKLKNDFVNFHASGSTPSDWIAKRSNGIPKGHFGHLFNVDLGDKNRVMKALSSLMIYSSYLSDKVTADQWKKFQKSVEQSPPDKLEGNFGLSRSTVGRPVKVSNPLNSSYSAERRAPLWSPSKQRTVTVPENDINAWFWPSIANSSVTGARDLMTSTMNNGLLDTLVGYPSSRSMKSIIDKIKRTDPGPESFGKVSFIQEPGLKLRAVANPNRIVQHLLKPLQAELGRIVRTKSNDFTFDQDSGIEKVKSWLASSKKVHTVDLSDATNNFPLDRQMETIRHYAHAGLNRHIDYFHKASTGPWRVEDPTIGSEREIRWNKGQPLGLGPSFFAFTLSHHELLSKLQKRHSGDFAVLGDDVALVGEDLKKAYMSCLNKMGCPVSTEKCLSSYHVSEFAGRFITKDYVLPHYKWKDCSDRSFLDVARNLGPRSLGLLKPKQRRISQLLALVPEWEGGLGWNPQGLTLSERYELIRPVLNRLDSPDFVTDFSKEESARRLIANAVAVGLTTSVDKFKLNARTRDQLSSNPTGLDRDGAPGLHNVEKGKAPIVVTSGDPRGSTTLEVLERRLKGIPLFSGLSAEMRKSLEEDSSSIPEPRVKPTRRSDRTQNDIDI